MTCLPASRRSDHLIPRKEISCVGNRDLGSGIDTLSGNAGDDFLISDDGFIDQLFGDGGNDSARADVDDLLTGIESAP